MPWSPVADLRALVDLAAPVACAGCGSPGRGWCSGCDRALDVPARPWSPSPAPTGMPPTWAGPAYDGVVRKAVVAWKDQGRADLTRVLAPVLTRSLAALLRASEPHAAALREGGPVLLVPAPSARPTSRARGWRPVAALSAQGSAGLLAVRPALVLTRGVQDQAGLDAAARRSNLAGAVGVRAGDRGAVRGIPCVVVDDVVTTGATLAECARALREVGAGPVAAAVVAATARRGGRPGGAVAETPTAD